MYGSISVVKCSLWQDPNSCLFPLFEELSSPHSKQAPYCEQPLTSFLSPLIRFICSNKFISGIIRYVSESLCSFLLLFPCFETFSCVTYITQLTQSWVVINKYILPFFFLKNFIYHVLISPPRSTPFPYLPNFVSSKSINFKLCCSFSEGGASHSSMSILPEGTPLKKMEGWRK